MPRHSKFRDTMRNPLAQYWPWRMINVDNEVPPGGNLDVQKSAYEGEHTMDLEELKEKLQTDFLTGLTSLEAKARLARDGPNSLTPPKKTPEWIKFIKIMFGGFALLLWSAAILCFVAVGIDLGAGMKNYDNLYIGSALVVVVFLTGLFTYYQVRSFNFKCRYKYQMSLLMHIF